MEENNEEKSTGYTGEYGNAVEGDYQDNNQSTYRYSYKDGDNESTHSGDYYAGQNTQSTENEGESPVNQAQDSTQDGYGSGQGQHFNSDDTGYQSAGYQNTGHQNTGYQNSGYQNNSYQSGHYQNTGYQNPNGGQPKNKKEGSSLGKKILLTVALAAMFGIVAGVCFNAVDYVSGKLFGTEGKANNNVQLGKTTDQAAIPTARPNNTGSENAKQAVTDVSSITEQSMPAVVAITSTTKGADYYDLFGQYYQGQDTTGSGSGFIVGQNNKELLIATNNHVIDGAKTISVQFIDGEIYEATEKGSDSSNDLAVVAVKLTDVKKDTMEKIKIADMGDSDKAKVGEMVIAIGNALGYGQSVTVGYISAKDREITETSSDGAAGNKIKALQTDAAINPGNSGGALLNMQGQVIGINSAKIADSAVEGVGYAIPISVATPIIDELMNREILSDDEKGYLGISGNTVTQEGLAYNLPYGVYVKEVAPGGAAQKAGIKVNDIITAINKMEVTTMESLQQKVNSYRKGTKIEVTVQRSNNGSYEEKKLTVTLQDKASLDGLSNNGNNNSSGSGNSGKGDSRDNENNNQPDNGNDNNSGNGGGSFWDFFR